MGRYTPLLALALTLGCAHARSPDASLEAALGELAAGKASRAQRTLRGVKGPDALCLLGLAQLQAGDPKAAAKTLAKVPADAECGRRAAFDRADALAQAGQPAEAVAVYAKLGRALLGPDRDRWTADWLSSAAEKLVAEGDPKRLGQAIDLLALAQTLRVSPERRRALARRILALRLAQPDHRPGQARDAFDGLVAGLAYKAFDLAALVHAVEPRWGMMLVQALPKASQARLRAAVLAELDPVAGAAAAQGLDGAEARRRAMTLAARRDAEALPLLDALAKDPNPAVARDASRTRARVLTALQRHAQAAQALADHLQRFPGDPKRGEVERALPQRWMAAAQAAAASGDLQLAVKHADAAARTASASSPRSQATWFAALAAASADPKAGLTRLAALAAAGGARAQDARRTWAVISARTREPAAVLAELERAEDGPSSFVHATLSGERLWLVSERQRPGQPATVQVWSSGLDAVEVRLHAVDAEAFVRSGGDPERLAALDVAVVAPDRRFEHPLTQPKGLAPARTDVALGRLKPGAWRVTVASKTQQASAVLFVSALDLAAHTFGDQLVVGVFAGGQPVGDARILARSEQGEATGRTDRAGFARLKAPGGPVTVLAERKGQVALLRLDRAGQTLTPPGLLVAADLDRPLTAPGEAVGVRLVVRDQGKPKAKAAVSLWLDVRDQPVERRQVTTDARGLAHFQLTAPPTDGLVSLMAQVDGAPATQVARLHIERPPLPVRRLSLRLTEQAARLDFTEPWGAGVADVPFLAAGWLEAEDAPLKARTDAAGRAQWDAPAAGLPWDLSVTHLSNQARTVRRTTPAFGTWQAHLRPAAAAAGAPVAVQVTGPEGPAFVRLERLVRAPDRDGPVVPDPGELELPPDVGPDLLPSAPHDDYPEGRIRVGKAQAVQVPKRGAATVTFGDLTPGDYAVVVYDLAGRARQHHTPVLRVADPAKVFGLTGVKDALPGDTLRLAPTRGPAVLAVSVDGRLMAAGAATPKRPLTVPVSAAWHGAVQVVAVGAKGQVARGDLTVDAELKVALRLEETPGVWRLVGTVTDARGAPVQGAQLALSAYDALLARRSRAHPSHAEAFRELDALDTAAATVFGHRQGAEAQAIDGRLLAEQQRAEEKRRAQAARQGRFAKNEASRMELDEIAIEGELSGMGFGGTGSGGGGGRGFARPKVVAGKAVVAGGSDDAMHLAQVLWAVGDTDAKGRFVAQAPRPRAVAEWVAQGVALTATRRGQARTPLTPKAPWLQPLAPGAAGPGDQASVAAVVHLPGDGGEITLTAGDARKTLTLPAGARTLVTDLGQHGPGAQLELTLTQGGQVIDRAPWTLPLAAAQSTASPIHEVAIDAGGGPGVAHLALGDAAAAAHSARRAAQRGLAALAARPLAHPAHHAALDAAVQATWRTIAARGATNDPVCVRFAAQATATLGLPPKRAAGWAKGLRPAASVDGRLAWLEARQAAGLELSQPALERLRRGTLSPPQAGRLARLLIAAGDKTAAGELAKGDDAYAALARVALGRPAGLTAPPPAPGEAGLAEWIQARQPKVGRGRGTVTVSVAGEPIGTVDLATGGVLRAALPKGTLFGIPGAVPVVRPLAKATASAGPGPDRLPTDVAGRLVGARGLHRDAARGSACGDAKTPCTLALGDALELPGDLFAPGWAPPAGFARQRSRRGWVLRAVAPATGRLRPPPTEHSARAVGQVAYRIVPALAEPGVMDRDAALRLAEQAVRAKQDPGPFLAQVRGDDAVAAQVAPLVLKHALATKQGGAPLLDALAAVRELAPNTDLDFPALEQLADAFTAAKRPERALAVWRAALGAAFLAQAGGVRRAEGRMGAFAGLKAMRALVDRYPSVDPVAKALFLLPQRLDGVVQGGLPSKLVEQGVTPTDLRLMAAQWDRAWLALRPTDPTAPEAGFHLVRTLLKLEAFDQAARWAADLARVHAKSPQLDGLLYLQGLALSRKGDGKGALRLFERIAREQFPTAEGGLGPAPSRGDARYAAARAYEALKQWAKAKAAYKEAAADQPDAQAAQDALARVRLSVPRFLNTAESGAQLALTTSNLPKVNVQAYKLDVRTLFVRDAGLTGVHGVRIAGVSPVWTEQVSGHAGPYPKTAKRRVKLPSPGAWLLVVDGPGAQPAVSLAVRSRLKLFEERARGGQQRIRVTDQKGRPVAGAQARIADGGSVQAGRTDLRGVLSVPVGAAVLVYDGEHVAYNEAALKGSAQSRRRRRRPAKKKSIDLERNIDQRMMEQIQRNSSGYDSLMNAAPAGVQINAF